jgi:phage-related protein
VYEVLFYEDGKGHCFVDEFLDGMEVRARAKVMKWLSKLEEMGPDLRRPFADTVRGKIRELRVELGTDSYRFLYFFMGKKIILTHGFAKKNVESACERDGKSRKTDA